jgi:hypothetical protein
LIFKEGILKSKLKMQERLSSGETFSRFIAMGKVHSTQCTINFQFKQPNQWEQALTKSKYQVHSLNWIRLKPLVLTLTTNNRMNQYLKVLVVLILRVMGLWLRTFTFIRNSSLITWTSEMIEPRLNSTQTNSSHLMKQ